MEFKDYYSIMGLSPKATPDEIKRAYRKLARKYHPDVSKEPNAEVKFKELGEAYEVLKDPEKRATYDSYKNQGWRAGQPFSGPPNWQSQYHQTHVNPEEESAFSDFFESLFGGSQTQGRWTQSGFRRGPRRGEDIRYELNIPLTDAYHGATKQITFPVTELQGQQLVQRPKTINVKIPPGVTEGQQIRLKGQGDSGQPAGDLYLTIHLQPIDPYHVSGKDISLYLPVSPWEAALGSKIKVPTLGGTIELAVPPNSQSGTKLRLKARGLPGKVNGDQYVILQVVAPPATTAVAKDLYQQMADKIPFNPREKLGV
jgi:curved DNA-binding protein